MSDVTEAMERVDFDLALAGALAERLGRILTLGSDEFGRPAPLALPQARMLLSRALREAADQCGDVGALQGDLRWCAPVALITHASENVWAVRDPLTCQRIALLVERLRVAVVTLRERSLSRAVGVRLS